MTDILYEIYFAICHMSRTFKIGIFRKMGEKNNLKKTTIINKNIIRIIEDNICFFLTNNALLSRWILYDRNKGFR